MITIALVLAAGCKIPVIKINSTTLSRSIYDHSFAVRVPQLWNAIPKNIKCAPSFEVFKSELTSHLMSIIPDLPPVPGYTGLERRRPTTGGIVGSSTEADERYKR